MLRQCTTCRSGPFDLTSGPGGPAGFQRQDGIGRRSLGKGRRVRSVIPAWRGQRTATNQTGAARHGRHGAHFRSLRPAPSTGKGISAFGVLQGPGHGPRLRPGLNVAGRHELPVKGLCLNVSNLRAAVRLARGSSGHRPSGAGGRCGPIFSIAAISGQQNTKRRQHRYRAQGNVRYFRYEFLAPPLVPSDARREVQSPALGTSNLAPESVGTLVADRVSGGSDTAP